MGAGARAGFRAVRRCWFVNDRQPETPTIRMHPPTICRMATSPSQATQEPIPVELFHQRYTELVVVAEVDGCLAFAH